MADPINPELTSAQLMEDFLQKLLKEAGMETVSPEVKEQMLKDLRARLQDRLFGMVVMSLSDPKLTEFRELVDTKAPQEEISSFIDQNVPDAQNVFANAMMLFRKDYLGLK